MQYVFGSFFSVYKLISYLFTYYLLTRPVGCADSGSVRIVQSPSGFAVVGSRLVLSCSYVSDSTVGEPVTVTWLRGNLKVESNVFVIESVRRRDEGHYTCLVNAAGHVLSADTVVRVQCMIYCIIIVIMTRGRKIRNPRSVLASMHY